MATLERLNFDNTYARLPDVFHTRLAPAPLPDPYLVSFNADAAALIGLTPQESRRTDFPEYFSGNRLLPGSEPLAMLYAGHQFGHYVPQLGDGRAILLGEIKSSKNESWDLHLKGAGQTPYSRDGDGRAVLRSTIREYLCSEAMHGLGIPTTRALCIVGSDAPVYREKVETAAVLTRLAPSHVRFGSFEVFYYRRQYPHITTLADYVIARYFTSLHGQPHKYARFFEEVVARTARLLAHWQAIGFTHGVMNTDNMSILGLTFDYGPFGFMERYHPAYICNHSDTGGRYAFHQQPQIGLWNLAALAQTLTPLIDAEELNRMLEEYGKIYLAHYLALMRQKLGLLQPHDKDIELLEELLGLMHSSQLDYTNLLRSLSGFDSAPGSRNESIRDQFINREAFDAWAASYGSRLRGEASQDTERKKRMNKANPKYILRNHLAQAAIIRAQQRDYSELERLLKLLRTPYDEQAGMESYALPAPADEPPVVVSCSS